MWFPRPQGAHDLMALGSDDRTAIGPVLSLIERGDGSEWQDRTGKAGGSNASAKTTVRLLECAGWVLKTDLAIGSEDPAALRRQMARGVALGQSSDLWHPSKKWLLMRIEGVWHPLTACRRLVTLREIGDRAERFAGWSQMIERAVAFSQRYGIGLDVNPSNFGIDPHGDTTVYYIDDELYPTLTRLDVAMAIASRIPQEEEASTADWRRWGTALQQTLQRFLDGIDEWREFVALIEDYPITDRYAGQRAALLEGLRVGHPLLDPAQLKRRNARRRATLTCVLTDVHANQSALEATLRSAREMGADSFLFLGDAVGYGPHPKQCIQRLAELPNATLIRGNHDHAVGTGTFEHGMNGVAKVCARWTYDVLDVAEREWLASLPLEVCDDRWMAVHGAPRDPHRVFAYVYEMTYQENLEHLVSRGIAMCFHGHTHVPAIYVRRASGDAREKRKEPGQPFSLQDGITCLINPGSVGQPRDGDATAAFALWERATDRVAFHRVGYPIEPVVAAIRQAELPHALIPRLQMGR